MRKAIFAACAAATVLCLGAPADQAAAMPIASPTTIGLAASQSATPTPVYYRRWHRRYGYRPYYAPHPYACCDFPDGYGYPPGPFWGLGGYLNSWYR
jgi:hypothetical protein